MATEGDDLRRSERVNKGQLPGRFEDYVVDYPGARGQPGTDSRLLGSTPRTGAGRGRRVDMEPVTLTKGQEYFEAGASKKVGGSRASVGSRKSRQSVKSQASEVLKMKLELEADEKIAEIQQEIDDILYEENAEEQQLKRLKERIETYRTGLADPLMTETQKGTLGNVLEHLKETEHTFTTSSCARQHKVKKLRTQLQLLTRRKEVAVAEIDLQNVDEELEDEDDVHSDEGEVSKEKMRATAEWAAQAHDRQLGLTMECLKSGFGTYQATVKSIAGVNADDDMQKIQRQVPTFNGFGFSVNDYKLEQEKFHREKAGMDRQLEEIAENERKLEARRKQLREETAAAEQTRKGQHNTQRTHNPFVPPGFSAFTNPYNQQSSQRTPFRFGAEAYPPQEESAVQQIAKVFQQAFHLSQQGASHGNNETAKFVARTAMARDLPEFSGKPEDWIKFKSSYDATTEACKFTALENLSRLQKHLKGEALKSVESMLIAPDNVPEVMATLERNFGRPQHIIRALVKKVESFGQVKENRVDSIIEFGTAVSNITATITALKRDEYLQNPLLVDKLEEKLSPGLLMLWGRWIKQHRAAKTLNRFSEWIKEEADTAREVYQPIIDSAVDEKRESRKKKEFVAAVKGSSDKKCVCCSQTGHKIAKCENFQKLSSNDRWKFIREKKLCIGCLNYGHAVRECRSKRQCEAEGCENTHHTLLHTVRTEAEEATGRSSESVETVKTAAANPDPGAPLEQGFTATKRLHELNDSQVNLLILPVKLQGPKGVIDTFAMLDGGSTTTLIRQDVADRLGLSGVKRKLRIQDLQRENNIESYSVNLDILTSDEKKTFKLKNVRTIQKLPLPYQSVRRGTLKRWKHLQGIDLVPYEGGQPTILIGQDNSDLTMPYERRKGPANSPMAVKTELGWVLTGPNDAAQPYDTFNFHCYAQDEEIHEMVKKYFSVESFGVKVNEDKPRSQDDKRAQAILDSTVKRVSDDRWETGLLWRHDHIKFPDSEPTAVKRLSLLEKKMDNHKEFGQEYCRKIEEYVKKGYAYKISDSTPRPDHFFLVPHFPVKNPKKPNKPFRLVFDAASKARGVSLNDTLTEGPDKLTPLPVILMKFRQKAVAVTADIAEMFHQVRIRDEDLPAQRFLFRGMDRNKPPEMYQMAVMIFGATCSPSCAQEVKNKNAAEFIALYPAAAKSVIEKHYVDDYLESFDTTEEAAKIVKEIIEIHSKGGFTIRSWIASNPNALQHVPEELLATKQLNLNLNREHEEAERVLGLYWQPNSDKFTFKTEFHRVRQEVISGEDIPTKREALSLIMSVFDPLGFLAHFMVKAKIMLQETWRQQMGWDDPLPSTVFKTWKAWLQELQRIKAFQIPRCYSLHFSSSPEIQLHVFVDASDQAYASLTYYRFRAGTEWKTTFVMAKTHVAPLKPISIVRMELQAALMGSRMAKTITDAHEMKIDRQFFWTDNRSVLYWIRAESRRFQVYVGHRVGEIQELTNSFEWHWIPTKLNVADEATRAECPSDWNEHSRWIQGPSFLRDDEACWPQLTEPEPPLVEEELEIRKKFVNTVIVESPTIDLNRFSRYWRLIRTTAWVFRYPRNIRSKKFGRRLDELSVEEIQRAERWWFQQVQQESFQEELKALNNEDAKKRQVCKKSILYKLCPQLDDHGVIRLTGRLSNTEICPLDTRSPIILPRGHRFTDMLIQYYHEQGLHQGQEQLLNSIRQRFYVPALRTEVRRSFLNCQLCKVHKAKPRIPQMAPLPECRLAAHQRPFTMTGLDYFGPFGVTVGRSHQKRYGCLFTCMTTRAVHLEIAHSLDTDSCIMAIRR